MARLSGTDGMVKAVAVATLVPGGTVAVGASLSCCSRKASMHSLTAFLPAALMHDTLSHHINSLTHLLAQLSMA